MVSRFGRFFDTDDGVGCFDFDDSLRATTLSFCLVTYKIFLKSILNSCQ